MKKLMLDVEQLEVESFATGGADGAGGTVHAHNHTRGNHASCWETCGPSCGLTCPATLRLQLQRRVHVRGRHLRRHVQLHLHRALRELHRALPGLTGRAHRPGARAPGPSFPPAPWKAARRRGEG